MNLLNILYIHQDGQLSGSALSLRNLLLGLDRQRFSPRVLLAQEGPARGLFEAIDIPVDMIPIHGMWTFPGPRFPKPDYFRNWLALLPNPRLIQYLKKHLPIITHVNDKTLLPAGMAAKKLKIPVVWHLRSSYAVSNSPLQAKISCQRIRAAADHLIAISEDETDGFEDLQNLSVIHNSVDFGQVGQAMKQAGKIRAEYGIGKDEMLVGTVSTSLNENRGSWDFIKAAGILQAKFPNTKLRFIIVASISNVELESEAWKRAEESGIRWQLILTGFRSDALSIMAAMDIVAICSRRGVLGRMPFEAMALGCPLVVTAGHSGKSHVVVDGQTALVVPAANAQAIADSMERLLQSPTLREQLSQQGKIYAREHFDPQKNAQAVMKIYNEILTS